MPQVLEKSVGQMCPECGKRNLTMGLVQKIPDSDGRRLIVIKNVCSCGYMLVVRDDFPNAIVPYREDLRNLNSAMDYFTKS